MFCMMKEVPFSPELIVSVEGHLEYVEFGGNSYELLLVSDVDSVLSS